MLRCVSLVLAIVFFAAGASAQNAPPVKFDGSTLRMTIANPPFMPGREWRTVLTRVE